MTKRKTYHMSPVMEAWQRSLGRRDLRDYLKKLRFGEQLSEQRIAERLTERFGYPVCRSSVRNALVAFGLSSEKQNVPVV